MSGFDIPVPAINERNPEKALRQLRAYVYQLSEQLRYTLAHLDVENVSDHLYAQIIAPSHRLSTACMQIDDHGFTFQGERFAINASGENGDSVFDESGLAVPVIQSPSIYPRYTGPSTWTIPEDGSLADAMQAFCDHALDRDVIVQITATDETWVTPVTLKGVVGSGTLTIVGVTDHACTLEANFSVIGCTIGVTIQNLDAHWQITPSPYVTHPTSNVSPTSATFTLPAVRAGHFAYGAWNTLGGGWIYQGYVAQAGALIGGFWFDLTENQKTALQSAHHVEAQLTLARIRGIGYSGTAALTLWGTPLTDMTGHPLNGDAVQYGIIGRIANGEAATFTLPAPAVADLIAPSPTIHGLALYTGESACMPDKAYSAHYCRIDPSSIALTFTYT